MNINKRIIFIFSIIIMIFSVCIYGYSRFNIIYTKNKTVENRKLENEVNGKIKKYEETKLQFDQLDAQWNALSMNFYKKYGYQFESNKNEIISKEILHYKNENENLMEKMKELVTNYGNYYSGAIYDSESFDAMLGNFTQLTDFDNADRLTDIPNNLGIFHVLNQSDGTIGYLKSLNSSSAQFNIMLFATALYSRNLNLMTKGEKIAPSEAYRDIINLKHLYGEMERLGYHLGNLNSENLIYLDSNFYQLLSKYYKNQGIIEALMGETKNEN